MTPAASQRMMQMCAALWGSQSWLQPAFSRPSAGHEGSLMARPTPIFEEGSSLVHGLVHGGTDALVRARPPGRASWPDCQLHWRHTRSTWQKGGRQSVSEAADTSEPKTDPCMTIHAAVGHSLRIASSSHPPAAPSLPPLPLRRPHLALVQPEVVRHLVPDRILHQLGEVLRTARQALVRALENRDAIRHRVRLEHAPPGQWTPFIETQQRPAARHAPARQLPRLRLGFHDHGDILQPFAKARRNAFVRGGHQTVEFGGLHGRFGPAPILGLLLAQVERLHLRDVHIYDAQFSLALAGELQLKVHDLVVALILGIRSE